MNSGATDIFAEHSPLEVLVLGYGNPMRGDDGVGPAIVSRLSILIGCSPLCKCEAAHQLLPEYAEDLLYVRRALFIDASVEVPPGKLCIHRLSPIEMPNHNLTHHVSPQCLLWMASMLYGHAPCAWSIGIGAADLSVSDRLSPAVAKTSDRLVNHLAHHLRTWSKPPVSTACAHASKDVRHVRP